MGDGFTVDYDALDEMGDVLDELILPNGLFAGHIDEVRTVFGPGSKLGAEDLATAGEVGSSWTRDLPLTTTSWPRWQQR